MTEPIKYFVIAVWEPDVYPDDYLQAARAANLPPFQTYPCYSFRDAVLDATINASQGIECVVCCTDRARTALKVPDSVRSVQDVALYPEVRHDTLVTLAERIDHENGVA